MQGEETPVVFDGTDQVTLRYCKDKPCGVFIKDLDGGAIGNKQTQATCEAAINIVRAAMYGSVDAIYLDRGQTIASDRTRRPSARMQRGARTGGLLAACAGTRHCREHHRVRREPCTHGWMPVVHRGIGQGLR